MDLAKIVRDRRRELGWSLQKLADAAGCSKAYLSGIENRRVDNPPRRRRLEALEMALRITPGELTRIGEWHATPVRVREGIRRTAAELRELAGRRSDGAVNLDALYRSGSLRGYVESAAGNLEALAGVFIEVPVINKVAAGYPRDFTDLDYPAQVADEYVKAPLSGDTQTFAARVVGESMMPEYGEGDIIVFSPGREAVDGADCFVRLLPDHRTTFKRVYFEAGGRVRLQPLNPAFAAVVVEREGIDGLYPAVMRMQSIRPAESATVLRGSSTEGGGDRAARTVQPRADTSSVASGAADSGKGFGGVFAE